ncbi:BREX-1 system adenine-specific DNA-methyltransferase PglX [Paucibacter sp. DJ4R-1]|nr:BREX-1 system adenine-specific DNA-methyltransferase PglX [Paucibacter sp. DJ4R-1]
MSHFLRLLNERDKGNALAESCSRFRRNEPDPRRFEVSAISFDSVPGKPFAYWVSSGVRSAFLDLNPLDFGGRIARVTNPAGDDTRFVRAWWEPLFDDSKSHRWVNFSKGGAFSPFFYDVHLVVKWSDERQSYHGFIGTEHRPLEKPASLEHFFRPGLTWARRTQGGLSLRALPAGCIFADKGPAVFVQDNPTDELLALLALVNTCAFRLFVSLQMAFGSYEVGVIQKTPVPTLKPSQKQTLSVLARRAWSLKRRLDTGNEISHAYALPAALHTQLGAFDPVAIEVQLALIQAEIDNIAFDLYGFSDADRAAATRAPGSELIECIEAATDDEDDEAEEDVAVPSATTLLSWAVGVAFGRFDLRLATGERAAPTEPEPFDPLPALSPAMLPAGATPFHAHGGILVDDPGHAHDLGRLVDEVLVRVNQPVPDDLRRWLQREFFAFHLRRYSKSRRKAPIYWPLSTASGSYTLWVYYPSLSSQTLFTAINDFVEGPNGKLTQVAAEVAVLRKKGAARARDDERRFETLEAFEHELIELRDTLLKIAPTFKPNHDDGVQITAAPLWPLFRHKPWQKVLKDTCSKLEEGDYDWAHLAMAYWPDRVREKCKTDKSLAIAHGLEDLYAEPEAAPKKTRGRKKADS